MHNDLRCWPAPIEWCGGDVGLGAPPSPRAWPRTSTASTSWRRTSRTKPATPPASSCSRATQGGPRTTTGRWSRPSCFGCATCRRRFTRRSAVSPPTGVNMTKLESYMIEGNFFATQFYADVEGHPEQRNLVFAFEELAFYSKEMKILGVYPAHPFRRTFAESIG